jgi:bifunctional UDP-N-acetylglucosamine pyrophosphorylase/glucosamine-1-phosphate N-acetyltransferase
MQAVHAVVLAAGKSTRFGAVFNKLLMPLCGKPLVTYITDLLTMLNIGTIVVVGHLREAVIETITTHSSRAVSFVLQSEPRGTGHALLCSKEQWHAEHILVLNGDMPLITADLITQLYAVHIHNNAAVSFVAAYSDTTAHAYGRVLHDGTTIRIVEARDFTGDPTISYPINAGIYIFKRSFLEKYAQELAPHNAQQQLYITDLVEIASNNGLGVHYIVVEYDLVRGVNTLAEFAIASTKLYHRTCLQWLAHGVFIEDPATIRIDTMVTIGAGTHIAPGVLLRGTTHIGEHTHIDAYSVIENSIVSDYATILPHSVITNSHVASRITVGPFAHLSSDVAGGDGSRISMANTSLPNADI